MAVKTSTTISFKDLQDQTLGGEHLESQFADYLNRKNELFERWYKQSGEAGEVYPSQGMLATPFDYLPKLGKTLLSEEELWDTLQVRQYMLELMNHPKRLEALQKIEAKPFAKIQEMSCKVMDYANENGLALSIGDLGSIVVGHKNSRVSRRDLLQNGPFIKLGKHARIPFASGAMPDVFGAPAALATVAMCHALACVPRNGVFADVKRQVDLVKATFVWMKQEEFIQNRTDRKAMLKVWKRNILGVIETERPGLRRAAALYAAGVRSFRVYSPEPGKDAVEMVQALRQEFGNSIEIFAGQVTSVTQAKQFEVAGADGLYMGIGGGGRCITAVRSGSVVDWPNLLWRLRGKVDIPVIVEGGASDHIGTTLVLGATGIGVSRLAAGGTIESPGGLMYWVNQQREWFKPYGGEASARTKYQDGKMMAKGIPAFVEGETTKAIKSFIPYVRPTVASNIYHLLEDLVLALVFRGVSTIEGLQSIEPSPLRWKTNEGSWQQSTH